MSFMGVLTIIFIVLKLIGTIDWSWFWVLSPFLFSVFMYVLFFMFMGLLSFGRH